MSRSHRALARRRLMLHAAVLASAGLAADAHAQFVWTPANANWNTTDTNWNNGGPTAWVDGSAAVFDGGGVAFPTPTINLGNVAASALTFNSTGYTIAGAAATDTLTLNATTPPPVIAVTTAGHVATISASLLGTQGFDKTGAGTLVLTGVNGGTAGLSGGINVNAGILRGVSTTATSTVLGKGAVTLAGGNLELFADSDTLYNDGGGTPVQTVLNVTSSGVLTLDRTVAGAGVTHTLSTLNIGGGSVLTVAPGAGVTSGTAGLSIRGVNVGTGGATITTSLNALTTLGTGGQDIAMGANALTIDGAGNLNVIDNTTGTGTLTKNGAGTLTFTADPNHTGLTTINGGVLVLNHSGSADFAVVVNTGGTLRMIGNDRLGDGDAGNPANETVTINTGGLFDLQGNDTIPALLGGGVVQANGAARTLAIGQNNPTFTWGGNLSDGTGVLAVNKNGTGVATFTGNNTLTGTFQVTNGSLNLTDGGRLSGSPQIVMTAFGRVLNVGLATDTAFNADRLNDANAQVELQDGAEIVFNGANNTANTTVETLKEFETNSGHNVVTLNPIAGGQVQVNATGGLIRSNKGTFLFRGTGLGGTGADSSRLILTTVPAMIGGGGAAGSTNISVIPFAVGSATAAGVGDSLVTHDTNGIRPLTLAEYATTIADGSIGDDNVRLTGPVSLNYGAAINSLNLQTGGALTHAAGRQLGLTSGAILAGGGSVSGGVIVGPEFFLIGGGAGTTTINAGLRGTGGLTIATGDNAGIVALGHRGAVTGEININRGVLRLDADGAIHPFARNNIRFAREANNAGATLRLNGSTQYFGQVLGQTQGTVENGNAGVPATFDVAQTADRDVGINLNNGAGVLNLVKSGGNRLSFVNDGNFSGTATVQAGKLEIKSGADWDSLTGVVIEGGTFAIFNTSSGNTNTARLPDTMDVTFRGGTFLFDHDDNSGTSYSERVGAMVLEAGVNQIEVDYHGNSARTVALTFNEGTATNSLVRTPGAVARFNTLSGSGGALGLDVRARIQIGPNNADPVPTLLKNGILHEGGVGFAVVGNEWATLSGDLTAGSGGAFDTSVTALTAYQTSTDATTWLPADNVKLSAPLTVAPAAPVTINSLILGDGVDLDLAGQTLSVDAGGILAITLPLAGPAQGPDKTISNGSITGGAFAGSEVVLRAGDDANTALGGNVILSASVVDNGVNATSFTKWGGKSLTLSGVNTFSGSLNVTEGVVIADGVNRLGTGAGRTLRLGTATLDLSSSAASETLPFATILSTTIGEGVITGASGQTLSFSGTLGGEGSLRFNNTVDATLTSLNLRGGLTIGGNGATPLATALPQSNFDVAGGDVVVGGTLQVGINQRDAVYDQNAGTLKVGFQQFGSELNIGYRASSSDPGATTTVTRGLIDLTGVANFEAMVNIVRMGVITGGGGSATAEGDLVLGVNSSIVAQTILQGDSGGSGNNTTSSITLGSGLNNVRVTNWTVGGRKSNGTVTIAPGGTLNIADIGGGPASLFIGDNGDIDTGTVANGTFDLTGGTLIARLENLDIGDKNRLSGNGGVGGAQGTLTLAAGAHDVSAVNVVLGRLTRGTGTPGANSRGEGTLNFGGGTFEVLNDLQMGIWAAGTESDGTAIGRLNITGGNFRVAGNITKTDSDRSAALIALTGGTLDLQIQAGNDTTPGNITASQLAFRGGSIVDAGTITLDGRGVTSGTAFAPLDDALILRDVSLSAPVALTNATAGKGGVLYESAGGGAGATLLSLDLGGVNRNIAVQDSGAALVDLIVTGPVSGAGGITKTGAGALALLGTSPYAGATTVDAGTLIVSGAMSATSSTTVNAGMLKGTGSIAGPLTIGDGVGSADAAVAPGASVGTLSIGGNLSFAADSRYDLEINSSLGTSDLLSSPTGSLTITAGAALTAADLGAGVIAPGTALPFIAYNGTGTGVFASLGLGGVPDGTPLIDDVTEFTLGVNTFVVDYNRGGNQVALVAVPEPAGVALLAMAGIGLLARRRR